MKEDKGIPKGVWLKFNKPETRRTYYFAEGKAEFKGVIALAVSPNGTHYLQTETGKYIVRCGWLYIDLDIEEWTYPGPFQFSEHRGAHAKLTTATP